MNPDDEEEEEIRPAQGAANYLTQEGYSKMVMERDALRKVERPRVVGEVAEAAAMGDRSENAEYIYGKKRLREIDGRLRWLDRRIDAAVIVNDAPPADPTRVFFGARVTVEDESGNQRDWTLVGEDEVDVAAGRISHRSPMGASLLGKSVDDEARVHAPSGVKCWIIVKIAYS